MDRYEANEDFGNEIQDLTGIIQDASKPSFHKGSETIYQFIHYVDWRIRRP
jgi:hypothetical protein